MTHRKRRPLLIVGLMIGSIGMPLRAEADALSQVAATRVSRTPGVIMMIGGMADDGGEQVAQAGSTKADAATEPATAGAVAKSAADAEPDTPDDASRLSVIVQPGSRSRLAASTRQPSEAIALRVMALLPLINEAAHAADLDSALLMAVIDVESGGNAQAISPKGATGLMQLMPDTGKRHGASNLFDPRQNVTAGARYLKALTRQFGELPLALAAYNAGEGAVQKYDRQIPPYVETMSYVPKVIARYEWYRAMTAGGAPPQEEAGRANGRVLLIGSGTGH